jgi:hypothetical protein
MNKYLSEISSKNFTAIAFVVLAFGFTFLICVSLYHVMMYFRPTLWNDQWGVLSTFGQPFSIHKLFYHANEHIILTSVLLFWVDVICFGHQNAFLVAVTFLCQLTIGGIIGFLWIDRKVPIKIVAALSSAATMVSLIQYENLLHAFQVQISLVSLFAVLALMFLGRACIEKRWRCWILFAVFVALSLLAAFSMANGVLVFGGAAVLVVLLNAEWRLLTASLVAGATIIVLFLLVYEQPDWIQRVTVTDWRLFPDVLLYVAHFLGAPFTYDPINRAVLGIFGLALMLGILGFLALDRIRSRHIPWPPVVLVCIAVFASLSGAMAGAGRLICCGLASAGTSRYTSTALIFWISALGAVWWIISALLSLRTKLAILAAALAAWWLVVFQIDFDLTTRRLVRSSAIEIDRGSMALINNVYLTDGSGLDNLYDPMVIKSQIKLLREHGWNIFSPREMTYVPPVHLLAGLPQNTPTCHGSIDTVERLDGQRLALGGSILHPITGQTPKWIFVRNGTNGIVGYFLVLGRPPDTLDQGDAVDSGFFAGVDFKQTVPTGKLNISLVAIFDSDRQPACILNAVLDVPSYETSTFDGQIPARSILGLRHDEAIKMPTGNGSLPSLPDPEMFTMVARPDQPAKAVFYFDAAALEGDDLAIPVASRTDFVALTVDVLGPAGLIESMALKTSQNTWHIGIIHRSQLPATGEVTITLRAPALVLRETTIVGSPFATPSNDIRASLY